MCWRTRVAAAIGAGVFALGSVSLGYAADPCPAQLNEAQIALARAASSGPDTQPTRLTEAGGLVREAEAACRQGDMTGAARKAHEALGVLRSAPVIGRPDVEVRIPPSEKPLAPTRPNDADYYQASPYLPYNPVFIGPTGRTGSGQFGVSAWIAPTTPVGSELAGGWRQQGGTPAIGFTFTWGGASRRPEPVQAP